MSDNEIENQHDDGNTSTCKEAVVSPKADANAGAKFVRTAIEQDEFDRTTQSLTERPTVDLYNLFEDAFDYFNERAFFKHYSARLPHTMITVQTSGRFAGYYDHHRWHKDKDLAVQASEIALNPRGFGDAADILSTLVHEMAHLATAEMPEVFGKAGKGAYHSTAWAKVMETIGLMPSNTGKPGGKKTGFRLTHYVIEGGTFDVACRDYLARGAGIPWIMNEQLRTGLGGAGGSGGGNGTDDPDPDEAKRRSKTKFSCPGPGCQQIVWGKPTTIVDCGACRLRMVAEDPRQPPSFDQNAK